MGSLFNFWQMLNHGEKVYVVRSVPMYLPWSVFMMTKTETLGQERTPTYLRANIDHAVLGVKEDGIDNLGGPTSDFQAH